MASSKGEQRGTEEEDPYERLACALRGGGKRGVETRSAVLGGEDDEEQLRVDFFRGKDFIRAVRKHHRKEMDELAPRKASTKPAPQAEGKSKEDVRRELVQREKEVVDDQAHRLGSEMLERGYFRRAERRYNKDKLKTRRRVRFPRYLEPCMDQFFDRDGFYVWRYERPQSVWSYVYSALLVLAVLACCLLQIAPQRVKLFVFYSTLSLFFGIIIIVIVRAMIFALTWTIFGKHLWVLPNLLSDDAPTIAQVVKPLWMIDDKAAKPPPLWKRLSMVGAVFGMFAASYWYAPSGTTAKVGDATRYAHDQMLDLLNLRQDFESINGTAAETSWGNNSNNQTAPPGSGEL